MFATAALRKRRKLMWLHRKAQACVLKALEPKVNRHRYVRDTCMKAEVVWLVLVENFIKRAGTSEKKKKLE